METPKQHYPLHILLADDGSQHALSAVALLRDLPLLPGSTITALAVLSPRESSNYTALQSALDQTTDLLKRDRVQVVTELKVGYPAETLAEFAELRHPDLIALGAKGLRATLGILLGGVAQQIVEYACCPVLVVRAPYSGLWRILLVTDGSSYSQQAVEFLGDSTRCPQFPVPPGAEVRVMHVLPPIPSSDLIAQSWPAGPEVLSSLSPLAGERNKKWLEQEECEGKEILANAIERLASAGIQARSILLRGDAATEIIHYAKENQIDLIVAGSRGLRQVTGWLLGSVSRKLVHYAPCSILIVKGEPQAAE